MAHKLRHLGRGRHIAAQGRQGLGEGAHVDVHLILQAKIAGGAAAALAQHAQAVGVVHHDAGAVLPGQGADLRQLGDVAAHGEHAVGDDQHAVLAVDLLQDALQLRHVVVAVAQHLTVAHLAPGVDAGVVLLVADHIVVAVHQGGDDAHVGLEAGAEGDNAVLPQELGQLRLQLQMQLQRAVEEAGAGAAGAVLLQGLHTGLDDLRLDGQAQVVVGAQHDAALALHGDLHILPGLQGVEIGIHTLFLQLAGQGRCIAFFKNIHCASLWHVNVIVLIMYDTSLYRFDNTLSICFFRAVSTGKKRNSILCRRCLFLTGIAERFRQKITQSPVTDPAKRGLRFATKG